MDSLLSKLAVFGLQRTRVESEETGNGQEEISADPATDEQCVSGVYKDLSELNHKNTNNLVKKRDRTQKFSKRYKDTKAVRCQQPQGDAG